MASDQLDRSEKATPKKRGEARNRGQVARSAEISSEAVIVAGLIALAWMGPKIGEQMVYFTRFALGSVQTAAAGVPDIWYFMGATVSLFNFTGLWLALIVLIVLISGFSQVGFEFAEGTLSPKWENLNPASGIQRLFSWGSAVRAILAILKIAIIILVCKRTIQDMLLSEVLHRPSAPGELIAFLMSTIFSLGWRVALVMAFLAAADYGYQRWNFERTLKMTKHEVKEENKQTEGNPLVRGKIRGLMRQRHRANMMKSVAKATVVITNPTHVAIALEYDRARMKAPKVTAKGLRLIAEKIKEIARENNIPVIENRPLARGLYRYCQLGSEVPSNFYQAVALILAQVYRLAGRRHSETEAPRTLSQRPLPPGLIHRPPPNIQQEPPSPS